MLRESRKQDYRSHFTPQTSALHPAAAACETAAASETVAVAAAASEIAAASGSSVAGCWGQGA